MSLNWTRFADLEKHWPMTAGCNWYAPAGYYRCRELGNYTKPHGNWSDGAVYVDWEIRWGQADAYDPYGGNYYLWASLTLGSYNVIGTADLGAAPPKGISIEMVAKYEMRLLSRNCEYTRVDYTGAHWGPRPRSVGHPEDDIDLRPYLSSDVGWFAWLPTAGGTIKLSVDAAEFMEPVLVDLYHPGGAPPVGFIEGCSASMRCVDTSTYDVTGPWIEGHHFGVSPDFTPGTVYWNYAGADRAQTIVTANRLELRPTPITDGIENCGLDMTYFPPLDLSLTTLAKNAAGISFAADAFPLVATDGPEQSAGNTDTVVATEFPVGTAIALNAPDSLTGHARFYSYETVGHVNPYDGQNTLCPASPVAEISSDGTLALGFVYSTAGLEALEMDGDAWRCPIALPADRAKWQALQVHYDSTYALPGTIITEGWTPGAGTTLTYDGAAGVKLVGTGTISGSREFDDTSGFRGERYLHLRIKSTVAGVAGIMRAKDSPAKAWAFTCGPAGVYTDIEIDTCIPDTNSGIDYSHTRAQREFAAGVEAYSQGGWGWGLDAWNIETNQVLEFEFTTDGPVWIQGITAFGKSALQNWAAVNPAVNRHADFRILDSGGQSVWEQRGFLFSSERRISLDARAGYVRASASFPDCVFSETLNQIYTTATLYWGQSADRKYSLTWLENMAGGASSPTSASGFVYYTADAFFNNARDAFHLYPEFRESTSDRTPIYAEYAVDRIRLHAFTGTNGGVNALHALRLHGPGVQGIGAASGTPKAGAVIQAEKTTVFDQDSTRADGSYRMPRDASSITDVGAWHIIPEGNTANYGTVTDPMHAILHRVCLSPNVGTGAHIRMAESIIGRVYRVFGGAGGVWMDVYDIGLGTWRAAALEFAGTEPDVCIVEDTRSRRLLVAYVDMGVKLRVSGDEGLTWGTAVTISATGTHPALVQDDLTGQVFCFWYVSAQMHFKVSSDRGATWGTEKTVADAATTPLAAADDSMACVVLKERARQLLLSYQTSGGAIAAVKSADNGGSWA